MTCNQLGGACDMEFHAATFEEIAEKSKQHGMQMHEMDDVAHKAKMEEMGELMKNPEAMQKWMSDKQAQFEALPED